MIPWFCVVTKPVKLGFGMPHWLNRTGIEPCTSIPAAVHSAFSGKVTATALPRNVRVPVAVNDLMVPSAGSGARLIGLVSAKLPAG